MPVGGLSAVERRQRLLRAGLAVAALGLTFVCPISAADKSTTQYFEELRDRRLFGPATSYCLLRLADAGISIAQRADLTIELSKTHAEHALYLLGEEQAEMWRRSEEVITQPLATQPGHPFRVLLEAQRAASAAARGPRSPRPRHGRGRRGRGVRACGGGP